MADRYVEVTSRSWRQRMRGSFRGIFFGLLMVGIGVVLLFWNEGRAVRRAKALKEGASMVVSVDGSAPAAVNEGKLVHFSGDARSVAVLRDPLFGVESDALKLERTVEMYQWREESRSEEKKKLGGGTETVTTYTYSTGWSPQAINSSSFKEPSGHRNPALPFEPRSWTADPITIGDWLLGPAFVAKLSHRQGLTVGEAERRRASDKVRDRIRFHQGGFFIGSGDPASPQVGDVRVRFEIAPEATVSVVGRQQAGQLVPYTARVGGDLALLSYGAVAADAMFESARRGNVTLSWILRGVGFLLVMVGFGTILKPLSVMADVVPMIGNLVERGTGMVAFVLAAMVSLVTIAVGWIYYRPFLGVLLLAAAAALAYWLVKRLRRGGRAAAPPPPPPPPPARGGPPPPPPPPPAG